MPDAQPLQLGDPDAIGGYRLTGRLGQGGQGVVYLGEGPEGRPVAVKLLHANLDDAARRRFVRELAATKRVARFCTAQVIDADLDGDRPFIVSEYVEGPSLSAAVEAEGVLADGALERLATGTLTALAAIHQAGVVHRDFKPGNVLLGRDGPRVIDFGIAKALDGMAAATQPSEVIGTPAYMAPEQVRGEAVGRPADVWAWAATLVFAATGVPPFGLDGITTVIGRILHADPNLGAMSGQLRDLVREALAKDPNARPSAQDLLLRLLGGPELPAAAAQAPPTALLELGEDRAVPDRTTTPLPPDPWPAHAAAGAPPFGATRASRSARPERSRFRPGVAAASAALVVLLAGGGVLLATQMKGEKDPVPRSSGPVAAGSPSSDGAQSGEPEPSRSSPRPQPTGNRPTTGSPPPAQAGVLKCTDTNPHTLKPGETSSGLGFDAVGGAVPWTASVSGAGALSSTGGTLDAGAHIYVALHLSATDLAAAGSSTLTVTGAGTSCSRTISWEARTEPTDPPTSEPTDPPSPEPTVTPSPDTSEEPETET